MRIGLFSYNVKIKSHSKNKFFLLNAIFARFLHDFATLFCILSCHLFSNLSVTSSRIDIVASLQFLFHFLHPSLSTDSLVVSLVCCSLVLLLLLLLLYTPPLLRFSTQFFHGSCLYAYQRGILGIFLSFYYFKCAEWLFMHGDIHSNPAPPCLTIISNLCIGT